MFTSQFVLETRERKRHPKTKKDREGDERRERGTAVM
jgi:hypothetical protein